MVLFVPDKSQKVRKLSRVILSKFLELGDQARIELSWPPHELINDLELFADFIELYLVGLDVDRLR